MLPAVNLPDGVRVICRPRLAEMIGEHVLERGGLSRVDEEVLTESTVQRDDPLAGAGELGLNPRVGPQQVLERLGFSGVGLQPVHLEARLWMVKGELIGPEGEKEPHEWTIIDDPWKASLTRLEEQELLGNPPDLELQASESLLSDSMIRSRLKQYLSERRPESLSEGAGMVLKRWNVELQSVNMHWRRLLLPAWKGVMPGHGESLIHGLDGSLICL
jgi:hypothetical protein